MATGRNDWGTNPKRTRCKKCKVNKRMMLSKYCALCAKQEKDDKSKDK